MRMMLAVAVVSLVVAGAAGQAQAPSWDSLPAPAINSTTFGGKVTGVEIKFADGSKLQADTIERLDLTAPDGTIQFDGGTKKASAQYGTQMHELPLPVDYMLNGHVRLTIPVR